MEVLIQWGIPGKDSSVEGIAQGILGRQDLKGEPPDRHVEVLIQWGIPCKDGSVEGIAQGILGRPDLKGEPPDRIVEVLIQWGIPGKDSWGDNTCFFVLGKKSVSMGAQGTMDDPTTPPSRQPVGSLTLQSKTATRSWTWPQRRVHRKSSRAAAGRASCPAACPACHGRLSTLAGRRLGAHRTADTGLDVEGIRHWELG